MTADAPWLSAEQQASWRAFIGGQTMLLDRLDRDLRAAHNISLAEYEVLVRLSEQPRKRMRMAVLADAMSHSRSRVTHTIKRMEAMELVERVAASNDGRGVEAIMTRAGQRLLKKAAPTHVRGVREHLIELATPEDLAAMGRVFNAVSDQLVVEHDTAVDIR